jgi:hypothetical protein
MEVLVRLISAPLVATERPDTIVVPELSRSSAFDAVPDADAVPLNGVPEIVKTAPETVAAGADRVMVANTPVAPDSVLSPITSDPAVALPVEDAAVFPDTRSATSCIRLVFKVDE